MKTALAVISIVVLLMVGSCEQKVTHTTPAFGQQDVQSAMEPQPTTKDLKKLNASPAYRWGNVYLKHVEQMLAERNSKTQRENH